MYDRIARREVLARLGISKSTLYQMMAEQRFPRPQPISRPTVGWLSSSVDEWIIGRRLTGVGTPYREHSESIWKL
jgi:prophage regulatory protein